MQPRHLVFAVAALAAPAAAESPRDQLAAAAFAAQDKAAALALVASARKSAEAALARNPRDRDAQLQRAIATGYRGQLTRNLSDVKSARSQFEALAAADPRNPEVQMGLAGWHLGAIVEAGPLIARATLGARRDVGRAALDRAVALGRGNAFFPAYAAMLRIRLDPGDVAAARALAEAAVAAPAPTPLDRLLQKRAAALLVPLKAGNGKQAAALARKLMPFGRFA